MTPFSGPECAPFVPAKNNPRKNQKLHVIAVKKPGDSSKPREVRVALRLAPLPLLLDRRERAF